jgi:hypothetical protein
MLNVADVNVISNNISIPRVPQPYSPQSSPLCHKLHSLPLSSQEAIDKPFFNLMRGTLRTFPDRIVQAHQHDWSWQRQVSPEAHSAHETIVTARDNCAAVVRNATMMNITASEQPAVLFAKPPLLHVDIWDQIIAPGMACAGMLVQSWLHSAAQLANACCMDHCTVDSAGVRFAGQQWRINRDHSKWGVCCDKAVVCFGDMNRVFSQRVRGGMALCFAAENSAQNSLPAQLYAYLQPALQQRRTTCIWKRREQCPCKRIQPLKLA